MGRGRPKLEQYQKLMNKEARLLKEIEKVREVLKTCLPQPILPPEEVK